MKNIILIIIALTLSLSACKIKTHIHFNKDYSGTVNIEIDLAESLNSTNDSTETTNLMDSMIIGLKKQYENSPGIRNLKLSYNQSTILMTYSFNNIKELNTSLNQLNDSTQSKTKEIFSVSKNSISYESPSPEKTGIGEAPIGGVIDNFPFNLKISFERKIKSCSNPKYVLSKKENSIEMNKDTTVINSTEKMNFNVKLK